MLQGNRGPEGPLLTRSKMQACIRTAFIDQSQIYLQWLLEGDDNEATDLGLAFALCMSLRFLTELTPYFTQKPRISDGSFDTTLLPTKSFEEKGDLAWPHVKQAVLFRTREEFPRASTYAPCPSPL